MTRAPRFVLIIPAFNEAMTIRDVVQGALAHINDIIVIDDGSTDETAERLSGLPIHVFKQDENQGKSLSLWRGMQIALDLGAENIITMDADGQHDTKELPLLMEAAKRYPKKLIVGARLWSRASFPMSRYLANKFANFWIGWASGQSIDDSQSGFRIYPSVLLKNCTLKHSWRHSFVFESEIIIDAARKGIPCVFAEIHTTYLDTSRPSHFNPVTDISMITLMVGRHLISRGLFISGLLKSLFFKPIRINIREVN
jgi:glycosyltransferase involved in cell wall biosynthesis